MSTDNVVMLTEEQKAEITKLLAEAVEANIDQEIVRVIRVD